MIRRVFIHGLGVVLLADATVVGWRFTAFV
jgi:hypothetical protein